MNTAPLYDVSLLSSVDLKTEDRRDLLAARNTVCSVQSHLVVLLSKQTQDQIAIDFDDEVTAAGLTEDGELLVVGCSNGEIHFIFAPVGLSFFSKVIKSDTAIQSISFSKLSNGYCSLFVLVADRVLHVYHSILLTALTEGLRAGDVQSVQRIQSSIRIEQVDLSSYHQNSVLTVAGGSDAIISTGDDGSGVVMWCATAGDEEGEETMELFQHVLLKEVNLVKTALSADGDLMVALTNTHTVTVWLVDTLVMVHVLRGRSVRDFVLCSASGEDMLCCITVEHENDCCCLVLFSLPGLRELYSMSVHSSAMLSSGCGREDVLFYSEIQSNTEKGWSINIKSFVQTRPAERLDKLLAENKFTEAFKFAAQYKLDPKLVYKRKAELLNKQLCSSRCVDEETLLSNLKSTLDEVKDPGFISELVLGSTYPSLESTHTILLYSKDKLTAGGGDSLLREKLVTAINKLVTFKLIKTADSYTPSSWKEFLEGSLLSLLVSHVEEGELHHASTLWRRHRVVLESSMDTGLILELLDKVPESVQSYDLGVWLKSDIIPLLLDTTSSDTIVGLADWIDSRVCRMELTEKQCWPASAIQLLDVVTQSILLHRKWAGQLSLQQARSPVLSISASSAVERLCCLNHKLQELAYVHSQLKLTVPLAHYSPESHMAVLFQLLDKTLAPEAIPPLLVTSIQPYLDRHMLDLSQVLANYIKHMLTRAPKCTINTAWEAKAIAVLYSIKNEEWFVKGCTDLLGGVGTHWDSAIEELVQKCLAIDHPSVESLKKQYDLLLTRRMLADYGMKDVNLSNILLAKRCVRHVINQEGDSVLHDALKIAGMYKVSSSRVYLWYTVKLIRTNKLSMIDELLYDLSAEEALVVAMETANYCVTYIQWTESSTLSDGEPELLHSIVGAAVRCVTFIMSQDQNRSHDAELGGYPLVDCLRLLQQSLRLQNEFSLVLTLDQLNNRFHCWRLVEERIAAGTDSPTAAIKFGRLLGFSEKKMCYKLATQLLKEGQFEAARKLSWCLVVFEDNDDTEGVELLVAIVMEMWACLVKYATKECIVVVDWMMEAIAMISLHCPEEWLLSCCKLFSTSCFLTDMLIHCVGAESELSLVHQFTEDGLVLSSDQALPRVLNHCHTILTLLQDGLHVVPAFSQAIGLPPRSSAGGATPDSAQELVQLFQDNSHCQLALRVVVQLLSVLTRGGCTQGNAAISTQGNAAISRLVELRGDLHASLTAKVLSSRRLDHLYGLSLLLLFPDNVGQQKILEARSHTLSSYTRAKALCQLAIDYGSLCRQKDVVSTSQFYVTAANWGKRLGKHKVSFTQAFRGSSEERAKVLKQLYSHQLAHLSLDTICQYCNDFNLSLQPAMLNYLNTILEQWPTDYQDRAVEVVSLVRNNTALSNQLSCLMDKKISPYDYERLCVCLEIFQSLLRGTPVVDSTDRSLKLLKLLCLYTRTTPPQDEEGVWFAEWNKGEELKKKPELPEAAASRLPFHLLVSGNMDMIVDVLHAEFAHNMIALVPLCQLLQLSRDSVLSATVKRIMARSHSLPEEEAQLCEEVVSLLHQMSSLNMAVEVSLWVVDRLHSRDGSIKVLQDTVTRAESHSDKSTDCSQLVNRLRKYLQSMLTENILAKQKILSEFTDITGQPAQLIMRLFSELSVGRTPALPVHEIASEIAQVWNVNLKKIRLRLAQQWLTVSTANRDMNLSQLSMLEDPTAPEDEEEDSGEGLVIKQLVYLLGVSQDLEENVTFLLSWAMSSKMIGGTRSRIRAIQVVMAISPANMIERISQAPMARLREHLQLLMFVAELEALHMTTSLSAFQSCSKAGLVRTLWRNHAQEPRAIWLVCELGLKYKMSDPLLWGKCLEQLLHLHMIPYLHYLLDVLTNRPVFWKIVNIKQVWQRALLAPVLEASSHSTQYQKQECTKSLNLLYSCPFLNEIDVSALVKAYISADMSTHALACAPLLADEAYKSQMIKKLTQDLGADQLSEAMGELPGGHQVQILLNQL